ncbi:MAG: hypothetical protein AABW84_01250 [Nanoarchaeota archaeon]|mgnify:CR=1 FL=1
MAKQTKIVKAKKRWFAVIAPEIFKHKEVGDVAAFEQNELLGRTVEISASKLTDTPKDQHRKIVLQISDVTGDKVTSVVKRMFFLDNYIQRMTRKYKEKFIIVPTLPSKDSTVKVKVLVMAVKKLHQKVRATVLHNMTASLTDKIKQTTTDELFLPSTLERISGELKNEVKTIYPIEKVIVWKIEVRK